MLILNRREGKVGTPLSELEEGTLIKIPENNQLVEFYLAKHNYEPGLNGAGRTLLVRKDVYDLRQWNSAGSDNYASSSIDNWLNSEYKNTLGNDITSLIGTTKIYYSNYGGDTTIDVLDRSVFLLSAYELGETDIGCNEEGSTLPNAANYQIANLNGSATEQWTRSPMAGGMGNYVGFLTASGQLSGIYCTYSCGSRPCFTLPSTTPINPDTMEVIA